VAAALDAASDAYQLHTLVNTAVSLFNEAGLGTDAEHLLQSHLPASHTPFYFMLSLAGIAKRRGDIAAVLDWYQHAYETAVGPATRIQWGVTYLSNLMELAATDSARIEQARLALLEDVAIAGEDARHQRNAAQLQKLARWPQLALALPAWAAGSRAYLLAGAVSGTLSSTAASNTSFSRRRGTRLSVRRHRL
jgi:hypothetical protein